MAASLRLLFGGLAGQEAAMHLDQVGRRIRRRLELGERIVLRGQRRAQPRDVQLSRQFRSLFKCPSSAPVMVGSSSMRMSPALTRLTVADMDRAHDAGLERLDRLGAAAWNDLARRDRDNVDRADARPGQRSANTAMMVKAMARPIGEGGVSTISSAAGRNASSSCRRSARCLRKGDDVFSGPHATLPGGDRGSHIGRRS